MTGLRVRRGLDRKQFRLGHGVDAIDQFGSALPPRIEAGLPLVAAATVRLTRRGVLMSSEVLSAIV